MKHIIAGLLLFVSSQSLAAADSVAVFFSAQKTVVLINEHSPKRLHAWMNHLGAGSELHFLSEDESIKVDCGRTETTASCTFRMHPSELAQFGNKEVIAKFTLSEKFMGSSAFEFESSRGDKFVLVSNDGDIALKAQKTVQ